ncbi:MAG: glutamine synthetase family protein [Pseudomonadota bacterium]
MNRDPQIYLCTSDISGTMRGKALPVREIDSGGAARVGWTPTNVQIGCFDTIADTPWGALGDLVLVGDLATRARIDFGDGGPIEDFALGDILHLDGRPWECCSRAILKGALERLERVGDITLLGAFEHEFHLPERAVGKAESYALGAFRTERTLCEAIMAALASAGIQPDTILKEYGPNQFEVTVKPVEGIAIADQAALLREIARATGERLEQRVSFAPLIEAGGMGNGVHIHLSFRNSLGQPVAYDAQTPFGMSALAGSFIAGVLAHLPAIVAFLAPSVVSYERLVPHRWSAAFNNLGAQDREAAVRLCPTRQLADEDPGRLFNFEVRACDAAASPHLALAAIVYAGAAGIEAKLKAPEATIEDLSLLPPANLEARGLRRLPSSLAEALDELASAEVVKNWFPEGFVDVYLAHKRHEMSVLEGKDDEAICAAYQSAY